MIFEIISGGEKTDWVGKEWAGLFFPRGKNWLGGNSGLLHRFKPSSKIFYWPIQGGTSFVDLLCFFLLSCACYAIVHVCL